MYFNVGGKQVFAATGGIPFDNHLPVVVFLHGSGLDHTFWGLHSRFFAFREYSVLALDLPGHTNSEGPAIATIEVMADWLDAVLGILGAENISIVAHSQGCLIALEYASRYPDKLNSVSFIASGLATPVNPDLIEAAEKKPDAAVAMMLSWGFGDAGQFHQDPIAGNSALASGRRVMLGNTDALSADLRACDAYKNGKTAAAAVAAPKQVILADNDRMAPRKAGTELHNHLEESELSIIQNSGHMLPIEAPNECRKLLRDFIFANNPSS